MIRRNLSPSLLFLILTGTVLTVVPNLQVQEASAVPISPYIMVIPEQTTNSTIMPGMSYAVSVYTDYSGNDVWAWEFSLTFNPSVLQMGINTTDTWIGDNATVAFTANRAPVVSDSEKIYVNQILTTKGVNYTIVYETGQITFTTAPSLGAEVDAEYTWTGLVNGDLISKAKDPSASFLSGTFNNTIGELSKTNALFSYIFPAAPPTTSGPGTLATVTFRVVGYGDSDVVLGQDTKLVAPGPPPNYFPSFIIIDASEPPGSASPPYGSDHIGNGHFENIHDVAITDLITPTAVLLGDSVAINVTVANGGNATAAFIVTVYANTTLVGNQTVSNLARGETKTLAFNWNTTTMNAGVYIINATAWLPTEDDPRDNTRIATIEIKMFHDVAVISLEIPDVADAGDLVTIKVTVANQGTFEENVNLTIYYQRRVQYPKPPAVVNSTVFTLGKRPVSTIIQTNWNTTGLDNGSYNINATVAIDQDEDPGDNTLPTLVTLNVGHDVSVTGVSATPKVFAGETVTISVTVQNVGSINETLVEVKVTCGTEDLGSQQIQSLNVAVSTILSFTWNTAGMSPEMYAIGAEAILDTDVNPTNNRKTALVVVAAPVGTIAGIVKDASGNPIQGASVTCGTYANTTSADGSYSLSNVLAGNYTVTASKNGYQTSSQASISVVAGETTTLNFSLTSLPTTGHIIGAVTDASNGNPIEGANVTAGGQPGSTNATGDYSIELTAGTYNVTVSTNGYESSSETDVNVVAGATTTVDFMLKPNEPLNILLYGAAAVGIIIALIGTAVYLRKRRKTT